MYEQLKLKWCLVFFLACASNASASIYFQLQDNAFNLSDWSSYIDKLHSKDDVQAFCQRSIWRSCQIFEMDHEHVFVRGRPREPIALWGNDYIDEGGHLFYARGLGVSQPLILVEGGVEHLEDVRALLDVVRQKGMVQRITISKYGAYTLEMACGSFQLGRKHLVKRAKVAMRLYPQLRKQHPNQTFHADLRYDGRFALSVSDSKDANMG